MFLQLRQQLADAVNYFHGIGSGLPLDGEHDGTIAVVPTGSLVVLDAVNDSTEFVEPYRCSVSIGDDHRSELPRIRALTVGQDSECLALCVESSSRRVR